MRTYACTCYGGLVVCYPRKILQNGCSDIASEATFGPKRHYSYHCYLYVFACMTLICIDAQWAWPLLKSPNLRVFSAEYYIGLLSLRRGHNIVRLDTREPGSLRHIQYVSHKGACCVGDCGGIYFVGATPPTAPPPPPVLPTMVCTFIMNQGR